MTKRRNLNTENVDACFAENEFVGSAPHKNECKTAMQTKSQHEATHEHHAFNVKLSSLSAETVTDRKKLRSD